MSTLSTTLSATSHPSHGRTDTGRTDAGRTGTGRGGTRRPLAVLGGLALGLGPLLLIGGNLTCPPQASNSAEDYVASLARDPFLSHLSAALYHYGWVLFGLGLLAAVGLVRGRRGRGLALVGGVGGALGAIQLSGLLYSDWFNAASGRLVGAAQGGRILELVAASPSLQIWMVSAKVGALLVPVLLFLGLARAGVISWWIAPLGLLGFVGGPLVGGLVGAGPVGLVVSTVASLVFNLPVFVTAARLVTRGRTATV